MMPLVWLLWMALFLALHPVLSSSIFCFSLILSTSFSVNLLPTLGGLELHALSVAQSIPQTLQPSPCSLPVPFFV